MGIDDDADARLQVGFFRRFVIDQILRIFLEHDRYGFVILAGDRERVIGYGRDRSQDRIAMCEQQAGTQNDRRETNNDSIQHWMLLLSLMVVFMITSFRRSILAL